MVHLGRPTGRRIARKGRLQKRKGRRHKKSESLRGLLEILKYGNFPLTIKASKIAELGGFEAMGQKNLQEYVNEWAACALQLDLKTKLLNETAFQKRVAETLSEERDRTHWFAWGILDIGDMHDINFLLGHEGGDKVIARVAEALRSTVGPRGFCSRAHDHGDEFHFFLTKLQSPLDAVALAEALREKIRNQSWMEELQLHDAIEIDVGIVCFELPSFTGIGSVKMLTDEFMRWADRLMFLAKKERKEGGGDGIGWVGIPLKIVEELIAKI